MRLIPGHPHETGPTETAPAPRERAPDDDWYPDKPLPGAPEACCCPAQPVVTVWMPPRPGRSRAVDLLLCGHHYRASRRVLAAAGAAVFDADNLPVGSAAPTASASRRQSRAATLEPERHLQA